MRDDVTIVLHGQPRTLSLISDAIAYARTLDWRRTKYKASAALVDRSGGSSRPYLGQNYDERHFFVEPGGWKHDHCMVCDWTLCESEEEAEGIGYADETGEWMCSECYAAFIKKPIQPPETTRGK